MNHPDAPTARITTPSRNRKKKRILFLCTHNSCRSQMAEGIVKHLLGDRFEASSAGTEPTRVHPLAVQVLSEIGIDISRQVSKHLSAFDGQSFDFVVTLCGDAHKRCPLFLEGDRRIHMGFPDPSRASGSDDEVLAHFRSVRDEIRNTLLEWLGSGKEITSSGGTAK